MDKRTYTGAIYVVTNLVNNKQYVGQTTMPLRARWRQHLFYARTSPKFPLQKAISKYGVENFSIRIIKATNVTKAIVYLNKIEPILIKLYDSIVPNGYNLEAGGNNKGTHPETRAKLSARLMGNQYTKGYKHTAETKALMSKIGKGKKLPPRSEEHSRNISLAKKGKKSNMIFTEEIRKRLREVAKSRRRDANGRMIPRVVYSKSN